MRAIDIVRRRARRRGSRRLLRLPLVGLLAALAVVLFGAGTAAGGAAGALAILAGLPDVRALEELPARAHPSAGVTRLYAWDAAGDPRRPVLIDTISDPRDDTPAWAVVRALPSHIGDAYLAALELWPTPHPAPAGGWPLDLVPPSPLAADLVAAHLRESPAPDDDPRRAAQDWLLARQLAARYSPDQLLEWTLNTRYYGQLAYGIEAAARVYFDRSAPELTPGQAALLAAVARNPAVNPFDDPAAAQAHRDAVLAALVSRGALTAGQATNAAAEPITTAAPPGSASAAPAFVRLARRELEELLGPSRLLAGGLVVETTLDLGLQEQIVCATMPRPSGGGPPCPARAAQPNVATSEANYTVVALDPRAGVVLALDGRAEQRAAIGTLIQPFIYLTALSQGHTAADLLLDVESVYLLDGRPYVPRNADETYLGPLRLRQALAGGRAVPATQVLGWVGPPHVLATARALGLQPGPDAPATLALAELGFAAAPLEVARAFAAPGNGGTLAGRNPAAGDTLPRPATIRRVVDAGGVTLYALETVTAEALTPELAYLLTDMLADTEALGATDEAGNRSAALATGEADGGGWAVGYTPERLITVFATGKRPEATAGAVALWQGLLAATPGGATEWPRPPTLQRVAVCAVSGRRPAPGHDCATVDEWFAPGTEPGIDTMVRSMSVNRETGRLATIFTPPSLVERRTFIDYPPQLAAWAAAAGVARPPAIYDTIRRVGTRDGGAALSSPEPWAEVSGLWPVVGSAGGEGFSTYRLAYFPGLRPEALQTIVERGATPVEAGELGVWDTTLVEDGLYTLLLTVVREDGTFDEVAIPVTVRNAD